MPITRIDPDELHQTCLNCGAEHRIPLKRAGCKSKRGPYALTDGDTLEVMVDGGATPQTITFSASDFADIGSALATDVAAAIQARLAGASADVDANGVRLASRMEDAEKSAVRVVGGTARSKLGFDDRAHGPLVLGCTKGTGARKQTAVDTIDLPHCSECGAKESLVRTWDTAPPEFENSFHCMHRRAVNALAEYLKAEGYSDSDAKLMHARESAPPPDRDARFPMGSLSLPKPPSFTQRGSDNATGERDDQPLHEVPMDPAKRDEPGPVT